MTASYDVTKFRLGALCKEGHDHEGSGKSLRYLTSPNCVTCALAYRRNRDAEKKRQRDALRPTYPEGMKPCPGKCGRLIPVNAWRCSPCRSEYHLHHRMKDPRFNEKARARRSKRVSEEWDLFLLRGSVSSSKARGLAHDITQEDIRALWETQRGRCYWTGVQMVPGGPVRAPLRPSLDRLDPTRGYERDNIVLSCLLVNVGRGGATPEETASAISAIRLAMINNQATLAAGLAVIQET